MGSEYGTEHEGYTAAWYDFYRRKSEVCLAYWENGQREIEAVKFDWYFFLTMADAEQVAGTKFFDNLTRDVVPTKDRRFVRVFMPYYGDDRRDLIPWLESKGVTPLEADVDPVSRFMVDNQVKINPHPRLLFYDLETDSKGGFSDVRPHRILSVAYGHTADDVECLVAASDNDKGEEELLNHFLDLVPNHDTLVAWNGDEYDEQVLRARVKHLGFKVNWRMVNFLDHLKVFKRYFQRDEEGEGVRVSFSLENVSRKCLGEGKVELDVPKYRMIEVWRNDREKLEEYNKVDVIRMCQLEDKFKYIESHAVMAQLCNRYLSSRALKAGHLIDGFVLRYGSENGFRFRSKTFMDEDELPEKIEGAFVMEPAMGLHEGVCDLDFSALYPSIIRAFNISPEKRMTSAEFMEFDKETGGDHPGNHQIAIAANGAAFRTNSEGLFPAIVSRAVAGREKFKQAALRLAKEGKEGSHEHRMNLQRSVAWKELSNALCLGTMASAHSRYYDRASGEAITTSARSIEQSVIDLARDTGIPAIYGDTDSGFVRCSRAVGKEFIPRAEHFVDEFLIKRGAKPGLIKLKIDAYFLRLVFPIKSDGENFAKKHYAGKKDTGKWDVRGLELIRSDGCRYARELQRRILELLLEARSPTPQKAEKIIRKWADRLFSGELGVDDLVFSEGLGQPLEQYVADQIHVRVAKDMLQRGLEVYEGMKVPYIFTGRDADGKLKAVHVDNFDGNYDPVHYWHRVYPASQRLLISAWSREKSMWLALEKYKPNSPQKEMFSLSTMSTSVSIAPRVIVLRLHEGDREHLASVRKVLDSHSGVHPAVLSLQLENGTEVDLLTENKIRLVPELIKSLENTVGHRVYYGKEEWDA